MNYVLEFVKKWMGLLLLASIVVGFFSPQLSVFKPALPYALMFLLFSSFLNLKYDFKRFFRWELLIFPVLNWIITPLIIYLLSKNLHFDYRVGLMIIVLTPPALGAPVIVSLADGCMEFVVSNVAIYNLISPLIFAFVPGLYFSEINDIVSPWSILERVSLIIFTPMIVALIVRKYINLKNFVNKRINPFKGVIQLCMITVVISASSKQIRDLPYLEVIEIFSITLVLSFLLYLAGFLLCRNDSLLKKTCPASTGHKNSLLSIITCLTNFNSVTAIPSVLYLISHHIWNGILIQLVSVKRNRI